MVFKSALLTDLTRRITDFLLSTGVVDPAKS
jgi:hypothetical protein